MAHQPMVSDTTPMIRSKCLGCSEIIAYPLGARWEVVSRITHQHLNECHGPLRSLERVKDKSIGGPKTMCAVRNHQYTASFSAKERATTYRDDSAPMPLDPHPTQGINDASTPQKQVKNRKSEAERIAELKADEHCTILSPTLVLCRICKQKICLDGRSKYYPGLWIKHRDNCLRIKNSVKQEKAFGIVNYDGVERTFVASEPQVDKLPHAKPMDNQVNRTSNTYPRPHQQGSISDLSSALQDFFPVAGPSNTGRSYDWPGVSNKADSTRTYRVPIASLARPPNVSYSGRRLGLETGRF